MSFTVDAVIDDLGYRRPGSLLDANTAIEDIALSRRQTWHEASDRLGVDAAYFHGGVPLVYFRGLRIPSDEEVEEQIDILHRRAWNHGRAPFLVVVLPNEVRVLDSLSAPFQDYTLLTADLRQPIADALSDFTCASLVSGRLARHVQQRPARRTIVEQLRADLRTARSALMDLGLPPEAANDLLGRSMFLQYLDHRNVLREVVPGVVGSFDQVLQGPVGEVYELFAAVHDRFNGDVFPVQSVELGLVERAHLDAVAGFLQGNRTGQLRLISYYDFGVIPAELLSAVYEEFLTDVRKSEAAYYTPEHVVDLTLDEVFPTETTTGRQTVLDPACGSGLFLARAYRRLIGLEEERIGRSPGPAELSDLLKASIFGCDSVESAVRVAAFSCYLVMLDHCSRQQIRKGVRFPRLLDHNLIVGDFFDKLEQLAGPYDIIASNPPWKVWTEPARRYVEKRRVPVADKQLAHAFLWACHERVASNGRLGLLMPAKALYNRSGPGVEFRRALIEQTAVELVIDFSAFRRELFADATAPMAIFVIGGGESSEAAELTFCTPRPTPLSRSTGRIVLSGDEIKRLPRREASRRPGLFKAALIGTLRDADLVELLSQRFPTIGQLESDGLQLGAGYQIRGGQQQASSFLTRTMRVTSAAVRPFIVTEFSGPPKAEHFHRVRDEALFRGPHILVARALSAEGYVRAAYVPDDAVFNDSILGIGSREPGDLRLQTLTATLNSSVVRYMLFLTATSWGVERPRLEPQDLRGLPIALPTPDSLDDRRLRELVEQARARGESPGLRASVDDIVFQQYGLGERQRAYVQDLLRFGVDMHYRGARSAAFEPPSDAAYASYVAELTERLSASIQVKVSAAVAKESTTGYTGVSIGLGVPPEDLPPGWAGARDDVPDNSEAMIVRRVVRVYRHSGIDMAKPAEARHWTRSAAAHDADEIVAECLRAAQRDERAATT